MSEASVTVRQAVVSPPLLDYERDVTSKSGENGVIDRALELIGVRDRWCVEFGAADGLEASNTFDLIATQGYSAVLIERDRRLFARLQRRHASNPRVIALRRAVGFDGPERLDAVLAQTPVPRNFDLLSVDIDGNDYHVWAALERYRPKLVVIEFNPTIPNEVDFVQARDMSIHQGASLAALARLANSKGYRLVHATVVNGVFVEGSYFDRFGILDDSPAALRANLSLITWLFQTYDGWLRIAGLCRLRWHGVRIAGQRLQPVPRWLRRYPPALSPLRRYGWLAWRALHQRLQSRKS